MINFHKKGVSDINKMYLNNLNLPLHDKSPYPELYIQTTPPPEPKFLSMGCENMDIGAIISCKLNVTNVPKMVHLIKERHKKTPYYLQTGTYEKINQS